MTDFETNTGHIWVDEARTVSWLFLSPKDPEALLVLGHGAGAGMRHSNLERLSEALARQGIATFRYQFPFMERGGGRDSRAVSLATVRAAVLEARDRFPGGPLFAGGHSFGGRMTSLAAVQEAGLPVAGLIFFAFPLHAPGKPGIDRAAHLSSITQPMLFLSGTRDRLAQADLLQEVLVPIQDKATLHWLETADHGYKTLKRTRKSTENIFEEMARVTKAWMKSL